MCRSEHLCRWIIKWYFCERVNSYMAGQVYIYFFRETSCLARTPSRFLAKHGGMAYPMRLPSPGRSVHWRLRGALQTTANFQTFCSRPGQVPDLYGAVCASPSCAQRITNELDTLRDALHHLNNARRPTRTPVPVDVGIWAPFCSRRGARWGDP
ncbi:hypothetical protein BC828DRAFT_384517 [Blastocladiella britannica]|nr:hypothetical protein BC828DRAFT_384517 [Blastocladiella britannica]